MWHTNDERPGSLLGALIHAEFQARNKGLNAFNTEALHRVELLRHKVSERVRPSDATEQLELLWPGHRVILETFEFLANPVSLSAVRNMHELQTNVGCVSVRVGLNEVFQLPDVGLL